MSLDPSTRIDAVRGGRRSLLEREAEAVYEFAEGEGCDSPWELADELTDLYYAEDPLVVAAQLARGGWTDLVHSTNCLCCGRWTALAISYEAAMLRKLVGIVFELWPEGSPLCGRCGGTEYCHDDFHEDEEGDPLENCPACGRPEAECSSCGGTGGPDIAEHVRRAFEERHGDECPLHGGVPLDECSEDPEEDPKEDPEGE